MDFSLRHRKSLVDFGRNIIGFSKSVMTIFDANSVSSSLDRAIDFI